jgi:hypothetical protein
MIKSEKKLKNLASQLNNNNDLLVIEAVEMLREEEPFEGAIGLLASCYNGNEASEVRKAIVGFMNDLKDKELRPEVMNEVKKNWKHETISMLVASCWQSGLDYSAFSSVLAEAFLKGDYKTAIECFTVIEESVPSLTKTEKDEIIKILDKGRGHQSEEKKTLAAELISVLR